MKDNCYLLIDENYWSINVNWSSCCKSKNNSYIYVYIYICIYIYVHIYINIFHLERKTLNYRYYPIPRIACGLFTHVWNIHELTQFRCIDKFIPKYHTSIFVDVCPHHILNTRLYTCCRIRTSPNVFCEKCAPKIILGESQEDEATWSEHSCAEIVQTYRHECPKFDYDSTS